MYVCMYGSFIVIIGRGLVFIAKGVGGGEKTGGVWGQKDKKMGFGVWLISEESANATKTKKSNYNWTSFHRRGGCPRTYSVIGCLVIVSLHSCQQVRTALPRLSYKHRPIIRAWLIQQYNTIQYHGTICQVLFFSSDGVCVNVCVLSSHLFWTTDSTCGRASRGHTGGRAGLTRFLHLPSAVLPLIFISRRIQPSLSLVDRGVEFFVYPRNNLSPTCWA